MGKGERQKVVIIGFDPGIQKKLDYPIKRLCRNTFLLSSSPPTKTLEDKLQRGNQNMLFLLDSCLRRNDKKEQKSNYDTVSKSGNDTTLSNQQFHLSWAISDF